MTLLRKCVGVSVAALLVACVHAERSPVGPQPIIDLHRHTPWPADPDDTAIASIRNALRSHNVVSSVLFITGREDVALYRSDKNPRLLLSPMFPCPKLTAQRKWCFVETDGPMPDAAWIDQQLSAGSLVGLGELVFNYAGISPDDPVMTDYWSLAAATMSLHSSISAVGRVRVRARAATTAAVQTTRPTSATRRCFVQSSSGTRDYEWFYSMRGSTTSMKRWCCCATFQTSLSICPC